MFDNSTSQPGKMGWGTELFNEAQRLITERIGFAKLAMAVDESYLFRHLPKTVVNTDLMTSVKRLMELDGIDISAGSFSFMHLERCIFGDIIPWRAQIIGSCVASGGMIATVGRCLVEAFLVQQPEQLFGNEWIGPDNFAPWAPANYRAGRDRGGLNGNMDGSFCAPHVQGEMEYGYLMCNVVKEGEGYNDDWFPEPQSGSTYRQWGANNRLIDKYENTVKAKLLESEKVVDADESVKLQTVHFKPHQICSSWGFAPTETIAGWTWMGQPVYQYRRRGSWAHNMTVYGAVKVNGQWWVMIRNSWGMDAHKNGCWFAVSIEDYAAWLRQAEVMSKGDIDLPDIEFGNPFPI